MTYPDQTIMAGGEVPGNCFQAALAGVLGVSINAVPHFPLLGIHHWMHACVAWLEVEHGLIVNTSPDPSLGKVRMLHIINGQTERGTSHAVIGDTTTGAMVHDPHPSRAGLTFINSRFYFHQKAAAYPACPSHGLAHPCETCAEESAAEQDRNDGVAPVEAPSLGGDVRVHRGDCGAYRPSGGADCRCTCGVAAAPAPTRHSLCGKCMTPHICTEDGPGCKPAPGVPGLGDGAERRVEAFIEKRRQERNAGVSASDGKTQEAPLTDAQIDAAANECGLPAYWNYRRFARKIEALRQALKDKP